MSELSYRSQSVIAQLPVLKRLLWLWAAALGIGALMSAWNSQWGLAVIWGVSVCLLPAAVFARYAGQVRGATQVQHSVHRFYAAEAAKFALTAVLFAVVFTRDVKINVPVFFCAFIGAQLASGLVANRALARWRRRR